MAPDLQGQEPPFGPQPQFLTIPDPRSGTAMRAPTPTLDDPRPQKSGATVRATTHVHHTPQKQNIAPISRQTTCSNRRRSQRHHPIENPHGTVPPTRIHCNCQATQPPARPQQYIYNRSHPRASAAGTPTTCPSLVRIAVQLTATVACALDLHYA